jgi:uncharacterized protein (DUF736 family)
MATVGYLQRSEGGGVHGVIQTLTFGAKISLRRNPDWKQGDDRAPVARVYAGTPGEPEIGAAWLKTVQRGDNAGMRFYTLTIDDPSLAQPLYLTAYPVKGQEGRYDVVWQRPRTKVAPGPAAPIPDEGGGAGAAIDDEIPF